MMGSSSRFHDMYTSVPCETHFPVRRIVAFQLAIEFVQNLSCVTKPASLSRKVNAVAPLASAMASPFCTQFSFDLHVPVGSGHVL